VPPDLFEANRGRSKLSPWQDQFADARVRHLDGAMMDTYID
jgi:hypothetical protein